MGILPPQPRVVTRVGQGTGCPGFHPLPYPDRLQGRTWISEL